MTDAFYDSYCQFKNYTPPSPPSVKTIRRLDREIWEPAACAPTMSFLEIGCGMGEFLLYLDAKGVSDFFGIDRDPDLASVIPETVRDRFEVVIAESFPTSKAGRRTFDRIVMLDVLEHFAPDDGLALLRDMAGRLTPGGRIVVRVPNAESPWGARYQFSDLTHKTAFTATSLRQIALASGLTPESCHGQWRGPWMRVRTDKAVCALLSRLLLTSPEIWTANVYAVFRKADQ